MRSRESSPAAAIAGTRAWVAFGGNLGSVPETLHAAARALADLPGVRLAGASRLWRSPALYAPGDSESQPDYANAVAGFGLAPGAWTPETFLAALQARENAAGRDRERPRWRARPLDLDLLWWHGEARATTTLVLPHPEAVRRAFVIVPWSELAPDLSLDGRSLAERAAGFAPHGLAPWPGTPWDTLAAPRPALADRS